MIFAAELAGTFLLGGVSSLVGVSWFARRKLRGMMRGMKITPADVQARVNQITQP